MSMGVHEELERINEELSELRQCKQDLAALKEFKSNSEDRIKEIKDNMVKIFDRIEGNNRKGLNDEIADMKNLLTRLEENLSEVYDRISRIEKLLEKTISEVYELNPIVKTLMKIEDDRKVEKESFRKEFRIWLMGFIGSVILTAIGSWFASNKSTNDNEIRSIIEQTIELNQKDQTKK